MGRKKKSKKGNEPEPEQLTKAPHSFVVKRGRIGHNCSQLMMDFRKLMEPFTASDLKVKKKSVIKDYVSVAGLLNVTHLVVFTQTPKAVYMRVARLPQGPTLTYKVVDYSLSRDVISSLRKPLIYSTLHQLSPLLVMNGFSGGEQLELKLSTSMWRNMFPSIDVNRVNLNSIRRCLLLNYNEESRLMDVRHYAIRVKPVGLSKTVKKLITTKKIPDLGKFKSVEEVVSKEDLFTESEGEGDDVDESRQVVLPQTISSRGNVVNEKSAVRLVEIGPRMTLELIKVEEGLMNGEVMYHSLIKKTKKEVKEMNQKRQQKLRLKLSRKRQQEENVRRKQKMRSKRQSINHGNEAGSSLQ
ncbi:suppressor of SWI4 1-like protein [Leptotrombidium deliense]|uniref:Suppressor of SWI4 1-like protein n=1 Tax=Leptotrombidium deliense TaxID=299467 RepID=A0A443SSP3_9ACAR|nr:suppressor of SWI4 1-like protein [Leptotrombidium deliense]